MRSAPLPVSMPRGSPGRWCSPSAQPERSGGCAGRAGLTIRTRIGMPGACALQEGLLPAPGSLAVSLRPGPVRNTISAAVALLGELMTEAPADGSKGDSVTPYFHSSSLTLSPEGRGNRSQHLFTPHILSPGQAQPSPAQPSPAPLPLNARWRLRLVPGLHSPAR